MMQESVEKKFFRRTSQDEGDAEKKTKKTMRWRLKCRRRKSTRRMGRQETMTTSTEMSSKDNPQEEVLLQFPLILEMSNNVKLQDEVAL